MENLNRVRAEFLRRLERIPVHGLGLSVDVYSPDLTSLLRVLRQRQEQPDYLELFRAAPKALAAIRDEVGPARLAYHGEGLWLTQPEAADDPLFSSEVHAIAEQLQLLRSTWLNHECATKYMAGYAFGTYLPPLFTEASAAVVADHAMLVQQLIDERCRFENGQTPLLLLEMPPLTYFGAGTQSIPRFFHLVTKLAPCGLVLDVGHLWTLFRYTGAWRTTTLERFVEAFLDEFPLDRVVEIHVAGLAVHESSPFFNHDTGYDVRQTTEPTAPPTWTDAHAAPIPPILFDMLDQILSHARLIGLKGLALEVDTKPEELIVAEYALFRERYGRVFPAREQVIRSSRNQEDVSIERPSVSPTARRLLAEAYDRYAMVVAGRTSPEGAEWDQYPAWKEGLTLYQSLYLPYEILHWGGELEGMFPESCRRLTELDVPLQAFVRFWFRQPRTLTDPYDFFLLKIDRFLEFIRETAPEAVDTADREADELRRAYQAANEPPVPTVQGSR